MAGDPEAVQQQTEEESSTRENSSDSRSFTSMGIQFCFELVFLKKINKQIILAAEEGEGGGQRSCS